MYIERELEGKLSSYLKQFKVVLVTGQRQAGKTTMLKHALPQDYAYITLDDMGALDLALSDPQAFLNEGVLPVVIDEVQQAPQLFRQVKYVADSSERYGDIVLTGSQTYQLMEGVSESLAGRVGILELPTLSLRETFATLGKGPYVPRQFARGELTAPKGFDTWAHIHRGSMPRLLQPEVDWRDYYSSYVRSYLERDVRQLINVRDELTFYNFMVACAARTGQLLNLSDIADTVGASPKAVRGWLSVLQASGIVRIVQPFWTNAEKRLVKTPKLYFMDTGLACYLTNWNTPEQLKVGAMAGHMFETFVVSEVLKSYLNAGRDAREVTFYRDSRKREIDLVIQDGRTLHPVEIKANMTVTSKAIKNFGCLEELSGYEVGFGHVVCQTTEPHLVTRDVQAVPVWAI